MVELVDHSAHEIWEAGNRNVALTGAEWLTVEQHATQLQGAATLVSLGGTGPSDREWAASPIWQEWAGMLRNAAASAKAASDTKNQMALRGAGDELVSVCEGCHDRFKPDVPTEGYPARSALRDWRGRPPARGPSPNTTILQRE
jgi:hypothetical protein